MERRIASESKQTVRGGPKPAKVGLHRRLSFAQQRILLFFENCQISRNVAHAMLHITCDQAYQ